MITLYSGIFNDERANEMAAGRLSSRRYEALGRWIGSCAERCHVCGLALVSRAVKTYCEAAKAQFFSNGGRGRTLKKQA